MSFVRPPLSCVFRTTPGDHSQPLHVLAPFFQIFLGHLELRCRSFDRTVVCVPHGPRGTQLAIHLLAHTHALVLHAWQFVWHGRFCFVLCCGSTHALEPSQGRDRHQDDIRCRVAFLASVAAPAATFEKDSAAAYLPHQARQMGDGKMGERGRLWRSGPASAAPAMGIRTHKHLPKGPTEGGALGYGLLGPQITQPLGA